MKNMTQTMLQRGSASPYIFQAFVSVKFSNVMFITISFFGRNRWEMGLVIAVLCNSIEVFVQAN